MHRVRVAEEDEFHSAPRMAWKMASSLETTDEYPPADSPDLDQAAVSCVLTGCFPDSSKPDGP